MTTGEVRRAWSKESEPNVMNEIVEDEDAIRGYEVNVLASITDRDNVQTSHMNRVMKVA